MIEQWWPKILILLPVAAYSSYASCVHFIPGVKLVKFDYSYSCFSSREIHRSTKTWGK